MKKTQNKKLSLIKVRVTQLQTSSMISIKGGEMGSTKTSIKTKITKNDCLTFTTGS